MESVCEGGRKRESMHFAVSESVDGVQAVVSSRTQCEQSVDVPCVDVNVR